MCSVHFSEHLNVSAPEFHFADGETEAPKGYGPCPRPQIQATRDGKVCGPTLQRRHPFVFSTNSSVHLGKPEDYFPGRVKLAGTEHCLTTPSSHRALLPLLMVVLCRVPMLGQSAGQHQDLIQV